MTISRRHSRVAAGQAWPGQKWSLGLAVVLCGVTGHAQGLDGLGPPGAWAADPAAAAVEKELLVAINALRRATGNAPLIADSKSRAFSRSEARISATDQQLAQGLETRMRQQAIAPFGYYIQYAYGKSAAGILSRLKADAGMRAAMSDDFARASIGAFRVPAQPPYWQVMVLLLRPAADLLPSTGLTREETDQVMSQALPAIQKCYGRALDIDPNAAGQVIFSIVIGSSGKITALSMLKSFPITIFNTCALNHVVKLRFPPPQDGKPVTLHHPINLAPSNGGRRIGRLSPTQVRGTFGRARPRIRRCYDNVLSDAPKAQGTVTVTLVVGAKGGVTGLVIVHNDLNIESLNKCILTNVQRLRFPRPDFAGEVDIIYPFVFAPPDKER